MKSRAPLLAVTVVLLCVGGALAYARSEPPLLPADPPPIVVLAPAPVSLAPSASATVVVDPVVRCKADRFCSELHALSMRLADAYAERHEALDMKERRIETFASSIQRAVEASDLSRDDQWRYAATLVYIAHRETRIARNPRLLGDQDQGRAHGLWQIWSWHGEDVYSPVTALEMMREAPESSWSLPKGAPWLGYPPAAAFVKAHPKAP